MREINETKGNVVKAPILRFWMEIWYKEESNKSFLIKKEK
jgi:hypothetical protein